MLLNCSEYNSLIQCAFLGAHSDNVPGLEGNRQMDKLESMTEILLFGYSTHVSPQPVRNDEWMVVVILLALSNSAVYLPLSP